MCLILIAHAYRENYPLVVSANRDEFHARPTAPLGFWDDAPDLCAGRDLAAGGTWMGVTRSGAFAALTNYRDGRNPPAPGLPSRGALVADFLRGRRAAPDYLAELAVRGGGYAGFNLLAGRPGDLWAYSNRGHGPAPLAPGIHGISNHLPDTPWPKVERGRHLLREALAGAAAPDPEALLALLADRHTPPDEALPDTGVGLEWERALAPLFIRTEAYGTRASTVLLVDRHGGVVLVERAFGPDGRATDTREERFRLSAAS